MAEAKAEKKARTFRFRPKEKVPFGGKLYRAMNKHGVPDYFDSPIPLAPNHHFAPVGEIVMYQGEYKESVPKQMVEADKILRSVEKDMLYSGNREDAAKAKVLWIGLYSRLNEAETSDPADVLKAVKELHSERQKILKARKDAE